MPLVAVTGATGHVGACLVRQLLARGDRVRVFVRQEGDEALSGLDVEVVRGDMCAHDTLLPLVDNVDTLYHCAGVISIVGPQDGLVHAVNVDGARAMGRAALKAGVRRMVHVCSVHAFDHEDDRDGLLDEGTRRVGPGEAPCYDVSKAQGEAAIRELVAEGLDAVIVHPSGVLGPFDFRPSRMGQVLLDLAHGRLPALLEGGFDWVDVRDACASMIAAAERGRTGESYILNGQYQNIAQLAAHAQAATGVRPPFFTSPSWLARLGAPFTEGWAKLAGSEPLYTAESLVALRNGRDYDGAKSAADLGHKPRPTRETIGDAYAWFAAHGRLASGHAPLLASTPESISLG